MRALLVLFPLVLVPSDLGALNCRTLLFAASDRGVGGPTLAEIFERELRSDPNDTATRRIYADWLEERGDLATAQLHREHADAIERSLGLLRRLEAILHRHRWSGGPEPQALNDELLPLGVQARWNYLSRRFYVEDGALMDALNLARDRLSAMGIDTVAEADSLPFPTASAKLRAMGYESAVALLRRYWGRHHSTDEFLRWILEHLGYTRAHGAPSQHYYRRLPPDAAACRPTRGACRCCANG